MPGYSVVLVVRRSTRSSAGLIAISPKTTVAPAWTRSVAVAAPIPVAALDLISAGQLGARRVEAHPVMTTTLSLSWVNAFSSGMNCDMLRCVLPTLPRVLGVASLDPKGRLVDNDMY